MPKENKIKSTKWIASPLPPLLHAGAGNIQVGPKVKKKLIKVQCFQKSAKICQKKN